MVRMRKETKREKEERKRHTGSSRGTFLRPVSTKGKKKRTLVDDYMKDY